MKYAPLADLAPITPKTASRVTFRWSGTVEHPDRPGQFGGRPYDWRRRAMTYLEAGKQDLEISFLTRQGWGPWHRVTVLDV